MQLAACAGDALTGATTDDGSGSSTGSNGGTGTCAAKIPEETAGPYPGDGSNGANVLNLTGAVRKDIRSSFAGLSGTAAGVLLGLELTLVSAATCAPLSKVSFTTIFPGCYAGRWPHIHFEVYQSLAAATAVRNEIATSQIALPKTACDAAYATSGYATSVTNLSRITLATDGIFSDGASLELATVTGDTTNGMTATLTVAV